MSLPPNSQVPTQLGTANLQSGRFYGINGTTLWDGGGKERLMFESLNTARCEVMSEKKSRSNANPPKASAAAACRLCNERIGTADADRPTGERRPPTQKRDHPINVKFGHRRPRPPAPVRPLSRTHSLTLSPVLDIPDPLHVGSGSRVPPR